MNSFKKLFNNQSPTIIDNEKSEYVGVINIGPKYNTWIIDWVNTNTIGDVDLVFNDNDNEYQLKFKEYDDLFLVKIKYEL